MKESIKKLCNIAILASLCCTIDLLGTIICLFMGSGLAITLGFVCIVLISYKYSFKEGLICGIVAGILEIIYASFLGGIIDPLQAIIEYPIALSLFGFAGIFYNQKKKCLSIIIPIVLIGLAKFSLHTIIGVLYWQVSFLSSVIINAPYILISLLIGIPLIIFLSKRLN